MVNIVMYCPEMPQNVGNIGRTCVLTGSKLHLIKPYMFEISGREIKRAGLDYWKYLDLEIHADIYEFLEKYGNEKIFLSTTHGSVPYTEVSYPDNCFIMFGKESSGLPDFIHERYKDGAIRVPMIDTTTRSLNVANTVAVVAYEALRQQGFPNMK
ncbi:MAG: tRNA (cytidine(34)-2'-O)-methyltransferase [Armatimonadetes bacterium]|nr:tRNA (cytidine(34)-2'-O)-methyltransferase [Candidatus Hippobium faecium]